MEPQNITLLHKRYPAQILPWVNQFDLSHDMKRCLSFVFTRLGVPDYWRGYENLLDGLAPLIPCARANALHPQWVWHDFEHAFVQLRYTIEVNHIEIEYVSPGKRGNPVNRISDAPFLAAILQSNSSIPHPESIIILRTLLLANLMSFAELSPVRKAHCRDIADEIRLVSAKLTNKDRFPELDALTLGIQDAATFGQTQAQCESRLASTATNTVAYNFLTELKKLFFDGQNAWYDGQDALEADHHDDATTNVESDTQVQVEDTTSERIVREPPAREQSTPPPRPPTKDAEEVTPDRGFISQYAERTLWARSSLTPYEAQVLVASIKTLATSQDIIEQKVALVLGLLLSTPYPLSALLHSEVGAQGRFPTVDRYAHRIAQLRVKGKVKPDERERYEWMDKAISLPLPDMVSKLFAQCIPTLDGKILMDALGLTQETIIEQVKRLLKHLRKQGWDRIILSRVENAYSHAIGFHAQDPVLIYFLCADDLDPVPAGAYYTGFRLQTAQHVHRQALLTLFNEVPSHHDLKGNAAAWFGVDALPLLSPLQQAIGAQADHIDSAVAAEEWVSAHNAITTYTILLLFHATGHRPVNDPFGYRTQLDTETGMCLINDKVMTRAHDWRLVCLPPMACQQLEVYFDHLRALSRVLRRVRQEGLASAIEQLVNFSLEPMDQPLPLFFYLDGLHSPTRSVTPDRLKQHSAPHWAYPLNLGRRLIATYLRDQGLRAELVNAQMGHLDVFYAPFGSTSMWAPQTTLAQLCGPLDDLLHRQGWQVVPGMQVTRKTTSPGWTKLLPPLHESSVWGEASRRIKRERRGREDRNAVRSVLTPDNLAALKSDPDVYDSLIEQIALTAGGDRSVVRRRTQMLYRVLVWRHYRRIEPRLPHTTYTAVSESSPFSKNTLVAFRQGLAFQQALRANFMAGTQHRSHTLAERHAWLACAAAAFNGLTREEVLQALLDGKFYIYQVDERLWIECYRSTKDGQYIFWRWLPRGMAKAICEGFARARTRTASPLDTIAGCNALVELLAQVGIKSTQAQAISTLVEQSRGLGVVCLSGIQRALQSNQLSPTVLPVSTMSRLVLGAKLAEASSAPTTRYAIRRVDADKASMSRALFMVEFQQCIKNAESQLGKGNILRDTQQRKTLVRELELRFLGESLPSVAAGLIEWTWSLCRDGTPFKADLAFNSIKNYARILRKHLIPVAWKLSFDRLAPYDYLSLYERVLKKKHDKSLSYRLRCLRIFHRFLVDTWKLPTCPWSMSTLPLSVDPMPESANVVSFIEYQQILTCILQCRDLSSHDRVVCAGAYLLAYRFNLRIGEALRVQPHHVQMRNITDPVCVVVDNTLFGKTKSDAGRRLVPSIEYLSQDEFNVLEKLYSSACSHRQENPNIVLCYDEYDIFSQVSEHWVRYVVQAAMRLTTGDSGLVFHHLRHSYTQRYYCQTIDETVCHALAGPIEQNRLSTTLGVSMPSPRAWPLLARVKGHANPNTGQTHYWHMPDIDLAQQYRLFPSISFTQAMYAEALNINPATFRKQLPKGRVTDARIEQFIESRRLEEDSVNCLPCELRADDENQSLSLAGRDHLDQIDLCTIDRLLTNHALNFDAHGIAQRFFISSELMTDMLSVARQLENTSRYRDFNCAGTKSRNPRDKVDGQYRRMLESSSPAVREGLRKWQTLIKQLTSAELNRLVEVWQAANHPEQDCWIFFDSTALLEFVGGMGRMGIEASQFALVYPPHMRKELDDRLSQQQIEHNYFEVKPASMKMTRLYPGQDWLSLNPAGKQRKRMHRYINRLLFDLGILNGLTEIKIRCIN